MLDTGADSRALGVFSSAFDRSFDSRWATTPAAGDGARVGGGALVDGELLDEATLEARENELATLSAHLDAATHRQLTLIRLMDVSERWAKQGAKSCAAWLSWRIGLAPGPAREHVRVAKALAALPQIDDALRRGAVSYSKVRAMTRVATPANEQRLLDAALETTAAQLEKICRGMRQVQREDGRPPEDDSPERSVRLRYRGDGMVRVEAVLLPDEAQRVMDALRLVRTAMSDEQAPPPALAQPQLAQPQLAQPQLAQPQLAEAQPDLADALTRIADHILAGGRPSAAARSRGNVAHDRGDASGITDLDAEAKLTHESEADRSARSRGDVPHDRRDPHGIDDAAAHSRGNGAHDRGEPSGFTDLDAEAKLTHESEADRSARSRGNGAARVATSGADRTQVIVHFTEDRIDGGHAALLDDGSRIAPETFRRLACDCALVGVREDHRGDPLDVGRKTRSIPPALRRAVMLRDEHCRFPGCTHDRHIDLHHIVHWVHGGPTAKANLIALCTFHHRLVHEGGFTLERGAGGLHFLAPERAPLPDVHVPPPAPTDPLRALEGAHADLHIHEETGLTRWDGERIHYGDVVEVLCADDVAVAEEHGASDELGDLDLPVRTWLAKHGIDA